MAHAVHHREHVVRPIARGIAIAVTCVGSAGCHSSSHGSQQPPPTPTGGLDSRPSNSTCVAPSKTAGTGATVSVQKVFPSLTFNLPLLMIQAPGDSSRWYV